MTSAPDDHRPTLRSVDDLDEGELELRAALAGSTRAYRQRLSRDLALVGALLRLGETEGATRLLEEHRASLDRCRDDVEETVAAVAPIRSRRPGRHVLGAAAVASLVALAIYPLAQAPATDPPDDGTPLASEQAAAPVDTPPGAIAEAPAPALSEAQELLATARRLQEGEMDGTTLEQLLRQVEHSLVSLHGDSQARRLLEDLRLELADLRRQLVEPNRPSRQEAVEAPAHDDPPGAPTQDLPGRDGLLDTLPGS